MDYFYAICGAKIGLSINITNDVTLYHSDRFINYIACGTFTLAKRVPNTELLFKEGEHVKYFDTVDEFFEMAQWYLEHDDERERIAARGMKHAHREFICNRVAQYMLDIVEKGTYDASYAVII